MEEKENVLKTKSFSFAVKIINLYKYLITEKKEYVLSKQLLRSGTAVGALIREAQNAESKFYFIHKLAIAQKECDETIYWLELLLESEFLLNNEFKNFYSDANEILKILKSSILTVKKNLKK